MKLFKWGKDGGPESTVSGFFFVEAKSLFSIALLRFGDGSREAFHSHAFNSVSWLLKGCLVEYHHSKMAEVHTPAIAPIKTFRDTFHKVKSIGTSWVLTFRGPWADEWEEYLPASNRSIKLTHGRKEV